MIIKQKVEFCAIGQACLVLCVPAVLTRLAAHVEAGALVLSDLERLAKGQAIVVAALPPQWI